MKSTAKEFASEEVGVEVVFWTKTRGYTQYSCMWRVAASVRFHSSASCFLLHFLDTMRLFIVHRIFLFDLKVLRLLLRFL